MNNNKKLLRKELVNIVDSLKEHYQPEKIILFGGIAKNKIRRWSDVDLVVIKKTKKRFYDRIEEVAGMINHQVPTDILVYTPEEFAQMAKENYFIKEEVVKSGKVLYAA